MERNGNVVKLNAKTKVFTTSRELAKTPYVSELIGAQVVRWCWWQRYTNCSAVITWGRKPSSLKAEQLAAKLTLPMIRLEDGFLRSVELGFNCPPYSVVLDDIGIYYDATSSSRLERLIPLPLNNKEEERARAIQLLWQKCRVSKYNHCPEKKIPYSNYVLVIDQTFGDASISFGLASDRSFTQMLQSALDFFPDKIVVVKTHPDVIAGKKRGHFDFEQLALEPRIKVIAEDIHAPALLEDAEAVFCVTSQMGFEALLWGKTVYCFGMPFYAGWGLTHDYISGIDRRCSVNLEQLIHAALLIYPHYIHPESGQRCEAEDLLVWMGKQRQLQQTANLNK